MNYPQIAIVGFSGSGKSFSIKNLPIDETLIINVERRFLPFKTALDWKDREYRPTSSSEFESVLDKALQKNDCRYLVIDSFTKYIELLLDHSRKFNKGYDIYNFYNEKIFKLLEKIKGVEDKYVIILAIDERVEFISPAGSTTTSRRIKVQGKEWEGKIEKEFSIVLFTDIMIPEGGKGVVATYNFLTNTDGTNSAKSPEGMFAVKINNDIKIVTERIDSYYGIKRVERTNQTVATTIPNPK